MTRWLGIVLLALGSQMAWAELQVRVEQAWIKLPLPGKAMTAAYMVLHNTGVDPVTLTGARWEGAKKIELHTMAMKNGVMHMRPIEGGVQLVPGGKHAFRPGGDHLMIFGLKAHPTMTDAVITLTFDGGESLKVAFPWRKPDDVPSHSGMHH
ncbi:MAG: copper chaperone PCu(A)C [Gammaproteobacteria bacterium]|nr:MAG: copper chaperone PCu(A)C [Gammaproteobacteria bacterium]